jgi:hypothetical protein
MARPKHTPDAFHRRQVEALAGYGVPEPDIAGMIGIDPKTLRKHYRYELDHGHTKANAKVAENLFRKATGEGREAVTAAIFWLKSRAHWKETIVNEHTGDPIQAITKIERIVISPPNWKAIEATRGVAPEDLGEEPAWSKWKPQ